jgi:hypothetical protein
VRLLGPFDLSSGMKCILCYIAVSYGTDNTIIQTHNKGEILSVENDGEGLDGDTMGGG